jgi:hypothetical protein
VDGQFSSQPIKQPAEPAPLPARTIDGQGVYLSWRTVAISLAVVCGLLVGIWHLRENHHNNVLNEAVQRARQQEAERIFNVLRP